MIKRNYDELLNILKELNESGALKYLILIGSWVEIFYKDYFDNYIYNETKTLDIDFYINDIPKYECDIRKALTKNGMYKYDEDSFTSKSKFYNREYEIEFLADPNRSLDHIRKIKTLNVNAESLSYLDIFKNHYYEYLLKDIKVFIKIPTPSAYTIQKIIINNQRTNKKEKDSLSITNMLFNIIRNKKEFNDFILIYNEQSKKRKRTIINYLKQNNYGSLAESLENN